MPAIGYFSLLHHVSLGVKGLGPPTPSAPPIYRPRKGPLAETIKQAVAFHARAQQAREAAVHLPALADLQVMMCSCCRF